MKRSAIFLVASVIVIVVAAAGHRSGVLSVTVAPAYAYACKYPNIPECDPESEFRTAAVDVDHVYEAVTLPVQPDDGESLAIKAYWNTAASECLEYTEVAYATVSWNGSEWVISDTTMTANITAVALCETGDKCGSQSNAKSWGYRLYVRVNDPIGTPDYNLRRVEFATTSVDDGNVVNAQTCTLSTAVSPTSQTFTGIDDAGFPCGFNCTASGAYLEIDYQ